MDGCCVDYGFGGQGAAGEDGGSDGLEGCVVTYLGDVGEMGLYWVW